MKPFNPRQKKIIALLSSGKALNIGDILDALILEEQKLSKPTLNRDLRELLEQKIILRKGKSRAVHYQLASQHLFSYPIDIESYFLKEADERSAQKNFNFNIFDTLEDVFSPSEKKALEELSHSHQVHLKKLPAEIYEKEFRRLTIDFSWKSSQIEGNTYSLLETEALIAYHQGAKGHSKEEAQMILNHKSALEVIREKPDYFKEISLRKIENLHSVLIDQLGVQKSLRKTPVGITGTVYRPLDNQHQIREVMETFCEKINCEPFPHSKALLASLMIAYIQPFTDGNKRTSRMLSNALLMAYGKCPLSYRSVDVQEYKKAVLIFYEQNNLFYFKKLFIEQAEFAVQNYFVA